MTKRKVWAIEDGSYSDYHVVGVFSSKKNAEMIRAKVGGDIVAWELDPAVDAINSGLELWSVLMLRNGSVEIAKTMELTTYSFGEKSFIWRRSTAPVYKGTGVEDALEANVWAKDKKHAIKIANEIRTEMIANNRWK